MALLCLLALLLQTTVFQPFRCGVHPDLVTVLLVNLGILNGSYEGAGLGFVAGVARGPLEGRFIGINGWPSASRVHLWCGREKTLP